jgi:uroporphyrin-III C-methyltransferase / precorrin-2 dehydrogenase / sirohydrochlorin ferrochelatase
LRDAGCARLIAGMDGLFPHFPVFFDLVGRPVAILGGDPALAEIARTLISAGAGVSVYDPDGAPAMADMASSLRIVMRRWRSADLRGAALVIAGAHEPRPGRARLAAKNAHAVFAMLGAPHYSDFDFGAQLAQGALSIAVSAAGLPRALEDAVRAHMAAALPAHFSAFLAAAARKQADVAAKLTDEQARAQFWSRRGREALAAAPPDWDAWIDAELDR